MGNGVAVLIPGRISHARAREKCASQGVLEQLSNLYGFRCTHLSTKQRQYQFVSWATSYIYDNTKNHVEDAVVEEAVEGMAAPLRTDRARQRMKAASGGSWPRQGLNETLDWVRLKLMFVCVRPWLAQLALLHAMNVSRCACVSV